MSETNAEELVRRWFDELFNDADLPVADEILASGVRYHGPESLTPTDVTSPADVKDYVGVYRRAFPDLRYAVDDVFGSDGRITARWTATGTHRSELFGIEPTGEVFVVEGINVFSVVDGEIDEIWSEWDTLRMVEELDVIPELSADVEQVG
ncbi:ester cyclase [Salinigranum marinum]|uniref:ester cyclase n=1 Tax=Salinigranum marinum TaxID=1515595 RepID=UPI002989C562|nr:ester cyclase [Salinigranum marinum]